MTHSEEIRQFLHCLFGNKHPDDKILIWIVPSKISRFFSIIDEAVDYCLSVRENHNVYFGAGLQDSPKPKGRGELKDITGITNIWLDLDISSEAHSKKNLPSSIDEVMEIMDQVSWAPTMTVHSGHGLQMYWNLRETYEINTESEREDAGLLVKRFQRFVRSLFLRRGYTIDSTHNLDRVMRVGGTLNAKKDPTVPVRILFINSDIAYNPSDFDDLPEIEEDKSDLPSLAINVDGLVLDSQASPPLEKFEALKNADIKFEQSWEHRRKDFPSGDTSQSTYDLSLATLGAICEWSNQEIVNLIQANRRKFKADPKLRLDYYCHPTYGVLTRARRTVQKMNAHNEIETEASTIYTSPKTGTTRHSQEQRESLWEKYSNMFGFKIYQVVRTLGDPPTFRMETEVGRVEFGDVINIINQGAFRSLVAARTKVLIDKEKSNAWDKIARLFIAAAIDEDLGDEATNLGIISSWVYGYLDSRPPVKVESDRYNQEIESGQPFIKDGKIYITMSELRTWVIATCRENIRVARLQGMLNQMGCVYSSVHFMKSGKDTTKKVWLVPKPLQAAPPVVEKFPEQLTIPEEPPHDEADLPELDF